MAATYTVVCNSERYGEYLSLKEAEERATELFIKSGYNGYSELYIVKNEVVATFENANITLNWNYN